MLHPAFCSYKGLHILLLSVPAERDTKMKNTFNSNLVMIGENIRKRREALGLSQTELATEVNIERARISEYENGMRDMRLSKLQGIAAALGCEVERLLMTKSDESNVTKKHIQLLQRITMLPEADREKICTAIEYMLLGAEAGERRK